MKGTAGTHAGVLGFIDFLIKMYWFDHALRLSDAPCAGTRRAFELSQQRFQSTTRVITWESFSGKSNAPPAAIATQRPSTHLRRFNVTGNVRNKLRVRCQLFELSPRAMFVSPRPTARPTACLSTRGNPEHGSRRFLRLLRCHILIQRRGTEHRRGTANPVPVNSAALRGSATSAFHPKHVCEQYASISGLARFSKRRPAE